MRSVRLPGATFDTSVLGLGCAGLFRSPDSAVRRLLLDTAYDAGITHFDVAPMYGLGIAERDLGRFARGRRDRIVIASKFGIAPTALARGLARVQGPARRLMAARPGLRERARVAASGPKAGGVGSLLYTSHGYGAHSARQHLESSLKQLSTDYLDVFLLHDPSPSDVRSKEVYEYLEEARLAGQIRAWGIAGEWRPSIAVAESMPGHVPVVQVRDDIFQDARPPAPLNREQAVVTFGVLGGALPRIMEFVMASSERRDTWTARVGRDCGDPQTVAALLLQDALRANADGVVLFSSTRPGRIRAAVDHVKSDPTAPDEALDAFRHLVTQLSAAQA